MKRRLTWVLVFGLLLGCTGPTAYTYSRPDATQADVSRDTFACAKEVREMHRNDWVVGPLWYVASVQSKAKRQQADMMKLWRARATPSKRSPKDELSPRLVDREVGGMKKYDPLHRWLNSQTDAEVSVSLQEIERIIGRRLPASARERPAWWANVQDRSRKWFCARPICNDSPLSARS